MSRKTSKFHVYIEERHTTAEKLFASVPIMNYLLNLTNDRIIAVTKRHFCSPNLFFFQLNKNLTEKIYQQAHSAHASRD
ncbi:hypothetical protein BpHYR1_009078 [Brachionus plicatilis]|uniref:Uncharacterized protein n=1 Tax=Brachionus plicatilis TaxID=10195 RepID=A0A3M7QMT6_BRAPC|nr:hypothetical protein BpHYR1_009078 [Brachionus plicatilis]